MVPRTLLLALLLAGCSNSVDINGHVHDPAGASIPNATVVLQTANGLTLETRTDQSGNFIFKDVPIGKHTLRVAFSGFQEAKQSVDVSGANRRLNVLMQVAYNCGVDSPEELKVLGEGPFVVLQEWGDFGISQRQLKLTPNSSKYVSEAWERKGTFEKSVAMQPGRFAGLLEHLERAGFWNLEPCIGGRGIDSGMKALTVSIDGRVKQVVIENDAPESVQELVRKVAHSSGLLDSSLKLTVRR